MFIFLIFLFLIILWIAFSGLFKSLLLIFGLLSIIIVLILLKRMDLLSNKNEKISIKPFSTIFYVFWLCIEIFKSNISVILLILNPKKKFSQKLINIEFSQKSDLGQVLFANSITLTPGTVTVELEKNKFLVHVLSFKKNTFDDLKIMNERVSNLEKDK